MKKIRIAVIGEPMVELSDRPGGGLDMAYSGDSLNTAVYLGRCDSGQRFDIRYVTALGDDSLSCGMVGMMREEGINPDWIHHYPGETPGLYMIHLDRDGERSFSYWRSQAPARKLFQQPGIEALEGRLLECDWIYFSGISLAILYPGDRERLFGLLGRFREAGGKVCFDINYRPRLWDRPEEAANWIQRAYRHADVALPSLDDEKQLFGAVDGRDVIKRLRDWGCLEVVVKSGDAPCLAAAEGVVAEIAFPPAADVVDTTAAGDSFNAGYLWARLNGAGIGASVRSGQKVAVQVIGGKGAIVPIEKPILEMEGKTI